jgi:DNA-binding NarL/FixJ family response regulator
MIRILIAEDHTIVRQGLEQLLGDVEDLQVTGTAANGQEVLAQVSTSYARYAPKNPGCLCWC